MTTKNILKNSVSFILFASFVTASVSSQAHHETHKKVKASPQVQLTTNYGNITIQLYPKKAPNTVKNFLYYVNSGFYNGTVFHRVIDGFMIQGGGYDTKMNKKTTIKPIMNEADNGLKNTTGTVAMARTNHPHSATAQFFINVANNNFLNHNAKTRQGWGYTVFGKVTKGMAVVNQIKSVKTGTFITSKDVPKKPVIIKSVKVISK